MYYISYFPTLIRTCAFTHSIHPYASHSREHKNVNALVCVETFVRLLPVALHLVADSDDLVLADPVDSLDVAINVATLLIPREVENLR